MDENEEKKDLELKDSSNESEQEDQTSSDEISVAVATEGSEGEGIFEDVMNVQEESVPYEEAPSVAASGSYASAPSIGIVDESHETKEVHVKKSSKIKLSTVLMVLLSAVLIGGTTYTVGYYNGQINLNETELNDRVEALLEQNYKSEIYKSVKDYIDESGINAAVSDADVSEIYKNVGKSIVGITSKTYVYDWFNNQEESQVTGSGVIIDETSTLLYIVTNYHVVSDATDVVVEIAKDQIVNSKLVGFDQSTDLAVLTVEKSDVDADVLKELNPISIGDSEGLKIGELAIAIGNPLGYDNTVTRGIISAVDRQVDQDTDVRYIQTDAAINPGNSGGALVNSKGELIGINTSKISDTDVEGIGFAIPSDKMMDIVDELMDKGFVSRPYIGIGGIDVDENTSDLYDIPMGVLVRYVYDGSPAEEAGVKVMDLIVAIDDEKVFNMEGLTQILSTHKPGEKVVLKVVRDDNEEVLIDVVLGDKGQVQ